MNLFRSSKTPVPYDMFSLARSADEAKRYAKCERIYHRGQELAWDGKETLSTLLEKHGGVRIDPEKREPLKRLFAIILWGELAAWRISAQLADRLEPLEAKMAATSQAHDEARHFYTMYDYLKELDYLPERLDRAPEALLRHVLETDDLAAKLLGMQLMVETIALAVFQEVREKRLEPVLAELMAYYEKDEARHVGLGMQYLPELMKKMSVFEMYRLFLFQAKLIGYALWENKVLERDFAALGLDTRGIIERTRAKQAVAMRVALVALGVDVDNERNVIFQTINAGIELMFPKAETRGSVRAQARAAVEAFRESINPPPDSLAVHAAHTIKTARGELAGADRDGA
ncbi:MAG TPA: ferritin-like domain-containing protein [Polyangiaceae bacterium]|nr:ferritin-like domain-containing protein [Polyangiaceae bacterium]